MSAAPTPQPDQFQYIKLPDGSYGKFRADADDSVIKAQIAKDFPDAYKDQEPAQTVPQNIVSGGKNLLTGGVKGVIHSLTALSPYINQIPVIGEKIVPRQGIEQVNNLTKPEGPAQKVGYYGEQASEFLLPGPAEEKAGVMLAEHAPQLGKMARPIGRVVGQVASNAAINKAQGGDATTGAIGGAIGGGFGEGMRAVAPAIAESALGITKRMRGYGKTPGAAVLDEISGVRPSSILKNATEKSRALNSEAEAMAASHPGTVDISPAVKVVDNEIAKAATQNNAGAIQQLGKVKEALTHNVNTGLPLAPAQSATGALNLKRGVRNQFVTNWNPEVQSAVPGVAKKASRAIDTELDTALGPKFADLNQRVSSIIPVAERAESLERGASIPQKVLHRVGAHTGALAGAIGGGAYGYQQGGLPGMIKMGGAGLLLPELLASPTGQMMMARALHKAYPARGIIGASQQIAHSRQKKTEDEDAN